MTAFLGPMLAIVWKDLLLELRTKDIIVSILVFALLVIVIFNLALDPAPQLVALVAPGILWVAFTFSGVLGLSRSFALEKAGNNLHGLMLAPVGRDVLFFGKMAGTFLFMMIVELVMFPVFAMLFNIPIVMPELVPIALLATLGIAAVGTAFSAMTVNTRSREVMLPLLFMPVVLPIILAAVEASGVVIGGGDIDNMVRWLPLLGVFDAVFLVICPVAFGIVLQE